ncbi:conserved hypothetical protein, secreted, partial [Candidatus Magnetomorum sp. HK-1]
MKKYILISGLIIILFLPCVSSAENETINERLIRVEESVKSLDSRLTQRIDDTNKQIDLLRQDTNKRIDDTNKQIDLLRQ